MILATVDTADRDAVERLYRSVGKLALLKTVRQVGRLAVAQEILHDVFLKLCSSRLRFPSEKEAYTWVYFACHNRGIDYFRSASYRRDTAFDQSAEGDYLADGDPHTTYERRALVRRLVRRLSERDASILVLSALDGMTGDEIADLLNISRTTVTRTLTSLRAIGGRELEDKA
jgi:RNA polymerase sigma-70 factor (ECF subfamily)